MNIEVQDITRLSVAPGEALLFRLPAGAHLSPAELRGMRDAIVEALPPGVKVLIASADVQVEVIADATDDGVRYRTGSL